jgi:hypothetical protein
MTAAPHTCQSCGSEHPVAAIAPEPRRPGAGDHAIGGAS